MNHHLKLSEVRSMFRLLGEIRSLGSDPAKWRTHLVRQLRGLLNAEIVISSEVHVRAVPGAPANGRLRVVDIGWGCDGGDEKQVWEIRGETDSRPEDFMVALLPGTGNTSAAGQMAGGLVAVRPTLRLRSGKSFVLSQYPLPHLGTVDQLGIHKDATQVPFTDVQHRLIRLFHVELGRLWRKDALVLASDRNNELPPRLSQTLAALVAGCSEKEVSVRLGISPHTVHNYVKALHQRFGVSSRGELLAKVPPPNNGFLPAFSVRR